MRNRFAEIFNKRIIMSKIFYELNYRCKHYSYAIFTILMISGYTGSVRTPRPAVMYSTNSLSVLRLISLPLRSAIGSIKSKVTQHCRSFRMNSSSCSDGVTSVTFQ